MHKRRLNPRERVVTGLVGMTAVSTGLFWAGAVANHSLAFGYLLQNLFLAWIPVFFAVLLLRSLRTNRWSAAEPLGLTLLWLLFLPNSFYMISDFIHIQDIVSRNLLYDVVMFTSFIFTATGLGFCSLYMVHAELKKRMTQPVSSALIAVILALCSFAIYLGRNLRWNSWDVLVNPAGVLFDVSDSLVHPFQHGAMFTTTLSFFVLLGSMYVVGWQLGETTRQE